MGQLHAGEFHHECTILQYSTVQYNNIVCMSSPTPCMQDVNTGGKKENCCRHTFSHKKPHKSVLAQQAYSVWTSSALCLEDIKVEY